MGGSIHGCVCIFVCVYVLGRPVSGYASLVAGFRLVAAKLYLEPLDPSRHAAGLPRGLLLPDPVLRAAREYRRFYHSCEENFIMEKRY